MIVRPPLAGWLRISVLSFLAYVALDSGVRLRWSKQSIGKIVLNNIVEGRTHKT